VEEVAVPQVSAITSEIAKPPNFLKICATSQNLWIFTQVFEIQTQDENFDDGANKKGETQSG
jgi:hypothetical protein